MLSGANLTEANLADAVLSGANLFNVKGLTQAQVEQAYGNRATRLPEGLEYPAHWLEDDDDGVEVPTLDVSIEAGAAEFVEQSINEAIEIEKLLAEVGVADVTPTKVPTQVSAPLEVRWRGQTLKSLQHPLSALDKVSNDGRASNYDHLKQEAIDLLERLLGNNVALNSGIYGSLESYVGALANTLAEIDVYRLGHVGIGLGALSIATAEIMDEAVSARLSALIASHTLFIQQESRWRDYVTNAGLHETSPEADREVASDAEEVTAVLEQETVQEIIDPEIPASLREQRTMVEETAEPLSIQLRGYWTSFDNTMIGLTQRAVDFTRTNEFGAWAEENGADLIARFGDQTINHLVDYGSHAVALIILLALFTPLQRLSEKIPSLGWLKTVLDEIKKKVLGDK